MAKKKKKAGPSRDKRGYYIIKKVPHVSVTTFLRITNKPFLYGWYASMERKAVLRLVKKAKEKGWPLKKVFKLLTELCESKAKAADRYIFKRGVAGNVIHKAIDSYLAAGKKPKIKNPKQRKAFKRFLKWWGKGEYRIIKSEEVISDSELKVAGTMDAYVERAKDKKRGILDWKTGKNIYADHHLQNVVYRHIARKSHPSSFGLLIHIPQDGGKVKAHKVDSKRYPLSMALHALDLWRDVNE